MGGEVMNANRIEAASLNEQINKEFYSPICI